MKLHRKIKHNEKVCRAHDLGSYAQGQGRNQVKGQNLVSAITQNIGVGRFGILGGGGGGQGLEYWGGGGGKGGGIDVISTSCVHWVLINQCQIITFLILKSDIIGNSRIELKGIVLPVPSNQIKVTFIIILPFNLVHL